MTNQNVRLSQEQAAFIRRSVHRGGYQSAGEVIRAGLRLLEQHEREDKVKLQALRRLAADAFDEIDQGDFQLVDPDDLRTFIDQLGPYRVVGDQYIDIGRLLHDSMEMTRHLPDGFSPPP